MRKNNVNHLCIICFKWKIRKFMCGKKWLKEGKLQIRTERKEGMIKGAETFLPLEHRWDTVFIQGLSQPTGKGRSNIRKDRCICWAEEDMGTCMWKFSFMASMDASAHGFNKLTNEQECELLSPQPQVVGWRSWIWSEKKAKKHACIITSNFQFCVGPHS